MEITDLPAHALSAAIRAREISCREVMQATLARIERVNPHLQRDRQPARRRRAAARGRRARRRTRAGRNSRAAGCTACRRRSRTWRRRPASARRSARRCWGTRAGRDGLMVAAHEGGRLHRHRQDQHARIRPRLAHLQRGVRRDPQRLRSVEVGRRQQRRRGGGAGHAHAAGGRWQRLHGQPAQSGGVEQRVRLAARARAACRLAGAGRLGHASSAPKGRWRAPCAIWRCCSTCRPDYDARAPLSLARTADGSPRPLGVRLQQGLRIGWLGDLDGYLRDGARHPRQSASRRLHRLQAMRLHGRADGARLRARAASGRPGWSGAAGWSAARIAPLSRRSRANRALIKPEALWEYDAGARALSGAQAWRRASSAQRFYQQMLALFERFDVLALPTAQVWPFDAAQTLAARDRRPRDGHLSPLDGGGALRDVRRLAGDQRPVGFGAAGLPMGMQLIGRPPRRPRRAAARPRLRAGGAGCAGGAAARLSDATLALYFPR